MTARATQSRSIQPKTSLRSSRKKSTVSPENTEMSTAPPVSSSAISWRIQRVREVLADENPEQGTHDRNCLKWDAPASAGEGQHRHAGEEADPPGDKSDLVVGPLDDQPPDDASGDGRRQSRDNRTQEHAAAIFLDHSALFPAHVPFETG